MKNKNTAPEHFKLFMSIVLLASTFSCSTETVKTAPQQRTHETPDSRYMQEGFIGTDIFRTVIIVSREECLEDAGSIQKKAESRALSSLKKIIIENGGSFDGNSMAFSLRIIEQNSSLKKISPECDENTIYNFDISSQGLKKIISDMIRDGR